MQLSQYAIYTLDFQYYIQAITSPWTKFEKSEKKNIWILVKERDGNSVTATAFVFDVVDSDDSVVQAEVSASVSGNASTSLKVYGLVDTTAAGFVDGSSYKVRFTVTIGDEDYKANIPIKIQEEQL